MGAPSPTVRAPAAVAAGRPPVLAVMVAFLAITAALTLVVTLATRDLVRPPGYEYLDGPAWLDGWFSNDSGWYYAIAKSGYYYIPGVQSPIAFFPTYPMTVRGVGAVIGDDQVAGSLVAVVCGAATAVLFAQWVWRRLPRAGAVTAIAVLLLYPYAFYLYGAMYGESLFLLTAIGSFVLLERRHYWLAGLVGALATAGRPVGVAVAVGLVVRMLEMLAEQRVLTTAAASAGSVGSPPVEPVEPFEPVEPVEPVEPAALPNPGDRESAGDRSQYSRHPRWRELLRAVPAVRWREAGVLVSGLGLAAWCIYLWTQFGDPLAFVSVQAAPGWYQGSGPHTWFKVVYIGTMIFGPVDVAIRTTAQALMCLFAVLLLRRVWRRFGWGYTAYSVVVLAIPLLGTKDFMGTGRYVLVAFPVVAAAGDFLASRAPKWVRVAVLAVLGAGLMVATAFYARGVEVS